MEQYYWLFPGFVGTNFNFPLLFLLYKFTPYTVYLWFTCGFPADDFKITCLHIFLRLCGVSGVASCKPRFWNSKVSVIGDIRVPRGLLGYLRVRVLSLRPVFHTCQSPTLLYCFGQVMHILGNKIALIFPLWTSVFPSPLFRPWSLA